MRQSININTSNIKDFDELKRWVDVSISQMTAVLDGRVSFNDNIDGESQAVTITSTSQDTVVTHGLNRVPVGYLVTRKSGNINIYDGTTPWTTSALYLRATATGTMTVFIF